MGLLDWVTRGIAIRTPNGEVAGGTADEGAVTRMIQQVLALGIDGRGPFASASDIAARALERHGATEAAVDAVIRSHLVRGTLAGFATSVGGFFTMLVAIPVNVLEFYVQATRMVAAVAKLRGYDVDDPEVRAAILLTLVGSQSTQILGAAGVNLAGGTLNQLAHRTLPPSAIMIVEKAVGFRILRGVGERVFSRLGKAIPVLGGGIGAAVDWTMMRGIAAQALVEFPQVD